MNGDCYSIHHLPDNVDVENVTCIDGVLLQLHLEKYVALLLELKSLYWIFLAINLELESIYEWFLWSTRLPLTNGYH